MKRFFKVAGIVVATPFILLLLVIFLLYLPPVQDYAVRRLTDYASEQTGMRISVERLRLSFLADLDLRGLMVIDAEGDTLVAAREAVVDLSFRQIRNKRIGVEGITFLDTYLYSKDMIAAAVIRGELQELALHDDLDLGAQRIDISEVTARGLDVDVALRDTTVEDTTESAPLAWTFAIAQAQIEDARVRFAMPGMSAITADSLSLTAHDILFEGERQHLAVPAAELRLPSSKLTAAVDMDFTAFQAGEEGSLDISVTTTLAKNDILRIAGEMMPEEIAKVYPELPLHLTLAASGNMDHLTLTNLEARLPGSIRIDLQGDVAHLMDSTAMAGTIGYSVETKNINWVKPLAGTALNDILLPPMQLKGTASIDGDTYSTEAQLREGNGSVNLKGKVNLEGEMQYAADVHVHHLQLRHFMPSLPLSPLTAQLSAKGQGTDFFQRSTRLDAEAQVQLLIYDSLDISGISMIAKLANGRGYAQLKSNSPLLTAQADVNAMLVTDRSRHREHWASRVCDLTFALDLSRADMQALGIADHPLKTAMCMHIDGRTDLDKHHQLSGSINDIILMPNDTLFRPEDVTLEALLEPDTTYAAITSGDLSLRMRGHTGYDQLLGQLDHFMQELTRQFQEKRIDEEALAHRLPQVDLRFSSGQHNPLHDILASMGYDFESVRFGINLDPMIGINGGGAIHQLNIGAMLLDTIRAHVYQDSTSIRMDARIRNGRKNPQFTFDSQLNARLDRDGIATANLVYLDERGRKGIDLGLRGNIANDTLAIHLDPLHPIIAYRTFHLNPDNYVMVTKGNHIDANVDLLADDGTGLKFYSSPNAEARQDLSVAVNRLNIGELSSVLPYLPRMSGFLHGDAHLIQSEEALSISTDLQINDFKYENALLGQLGLQAVYLPNADGSHFVDGSLLHTGMPVATFTGSYVPTEDDGELDVDATLDRFPFSLGNAFIPDDMARLDGVAIGNLHVGGSTSKPVVNGDIVSSGLRILSDPYSLQLRVVDDTISIRESQLNLDRIAIYSTGENPFTMDGTINFADLDHIALNANMTANNFELINAKKTPKSVAYGKVFVDFSARLRGTLDDLNMFGRLKVLGNTDVTYMLIDSPLTTDDQVAELVEFVDFSDTLRVETEEAQKPQHMNITMSIEVEDAAQVHCILSPDASSYVDLEGGGTLMMTYTPEKDLQMTGRYTINRGTMKYTMMVIPLKEFTIKSGSYAEFHGPLMNPTLNITATERMRTTITENDQPRSVNFDVGLKLSQTLENLGLEFTLDAPEDMNIQNELSTMSAEQRGRLAVTMLATGMYINDAGATTGGGVTGQNALNAFLQSQVSNITGKALKSIDLSMGVEQGTSATGSTTTDYSFRFAKRFWGNRVSVIVGGKVSTGENAVNTGESIIDNVSIEYRLDKGASRYVNVFYDKNYESLLDGEITEMGAGLVLRRKTDKWGELFMFKKDK